jgi:hypothetical protein
MLAGHQSFGHIFTFNEVFAKELTVINDRRREQTRSLASLREKDTDSTGEVVLVPEDGSDLIGLSMSGGGIRSAAFCLGALQALDETEVLKRVDYLSTVSGGGYIGCSLSACLDLAKGEFPFKTTRFEDETPALQHIRDYSNYLLPNGMIDAFHNLSIYVRGLIANFVLIMPFLLLAAAATIFLSPTVQSLKEMSLFGTRVPNIFPFNTFVLTAHLTVILLVVVIAWTWYRSRASVEVKSEVPSHWTTFVGIATFIVVISGFCELQPLVLAASFEPQSVPIITPLSHFVNKITVAVAPFAAIVAFLARQLGEFVKSGTESSRARTQLAGYLAKLAIYVAAIIVPMLLWAVYLKLAKLGICLNEGAPPCSVSNWLQDIAGNGKFYLVVCGGYISIAAVFVVLALFLRPNANSLHPLYRDRLGKAFLFVPKTTLHKYSELKPLKMCLSKLTCKFGPYHLINTSLNIQNSKAANKRGRNAEFFSFSRDFVGSEATGYVATADVEKVTKELDLASVMAISGAAASSNMGAQSIKPLTPTLAILNIRLGYWLRNPLKLKKWRHWNRWANFYFLAELFGRLNEHRTSVYLTDGSHIENLGIYELLKRRCSLIIAIDAEADFELAFGSFNTLVRYARIDLGIEIDLPWEQIRDNNRTINDEMEKTGNCQKLEGPHCAIGRITYAGGTKGILVYIKSSLTGDENDYVFHYKKRHPRFPHESTLEQIFSEEQFEVYRALGYHATYGLFDRRDTFAQLDLAEYPDYLTQVAFIDQLLPRATTGGPPRRYQHLVDWLSPNQAAQ